jgi:hypothetical protein
MQLIIPKPQAPFSVSWEQELKKHIERIFQYYNKSTPEQISFT